MKIEDIAKRMNAFCDPTRLKVFKEVFYKEKCVGRVAKDLGLPIQNVSHHLRFLESLGFVEARREGKFIRYRAKENALEILNILKGFFSRYSDLERGENSGKIFL